MEFDGSLEYIGSGRDAVVWEWIQPNNTVRIIRYTINHTRTDENIINDINVYRQQSPLFIYTYKMIKLDYLPRELIPEDDEIDEIVSDSIKNNLRNLSNIQWIYIQIQEDAGIQIANDPGEIETHDVVCMLFDFLFGILIAREISGSFAHNDIHERNLTIIKSPKRNARFYVDDIEFVVRSDFQLHLIDYDTVTHPGHVTVNDLNHGISIIQQLDKKVRSFLNWFDEKEWRDTKDDISYADEVDKLKLLLKNHPLFESLRSIESRKKQKTCVQCFGPANFKTENAECKFFCGNECNKQYHFIYFFQSRVFIF